MVDIVARTQAIFLCEAAAKPGLDDVSLMGWRQSNNASRTEFLPTGLDLITVVFPDNHNQTPG